MAEYSTSPPDPRAERALDHPTRRAILDLLIGEKGIAPRAISEKLGVGAANASYHADVLIACGLVEVAPGGGRRRERVIRLPRSPVENKKRWLDLSGSMRDDISAAQLKSLIEAASELRPGSAPGT